MRGEAAEGTLPALPGLRLEETGGEIRTVGLAAIGHAELTTRVSAWASSTEARAVLFRVAAYVVGAGARLHPGGVLAYEDGTLTLRSADGCLEVVSTPGSGAG